jgi:hypothetical protein
MWCLQALQGLNGAMPGGDAHERLSRLLRSATFFPVPGGAAPAGAAAAPALAEEVTVPEPSAANLQVLVRCSLCMPHGIFDCLVNSRATGHNGGARAGVCQVDLMLCCTCVVSRVSNEQSCSWRVHRERALP